jgi:hypothetical protein
MDDDYEETLLIINECFVYKIPPRSSAEGYRAKDWNIETFIWSGRLVIKAQGEMCVIRLEDPNTGTPSFCRCLPSCALSIDLKASIALLCKARKK